VRAWRVHRLGDPAEVLQLEEADPPEPGPGQVRVAVEATGLNFPDLLMIAGRYQDRPPLPFTPGLEVAGVVTAAGKGSSHKVGDRVIGAPVLPDGGLADEALLPDDGCYPWPLEMPAADAAALFITYQTAYVGLHRRAALKPGEVLLVHAGASGVGSAAIQLGKHAGATVITTSGGPAKTAACRELGAEVALDHTTDDWVAAVKQATGGRGADVIWDPVGGDVFDASRRCIAFEGRLVVVGFAGGRIPEAPASHVLVKNYSVVGLHWGLYRRYEPALITETHDALLRLHAAGVVRPLIDRVLPLEQAVEALGLLATRQVTGKIVLRPRPGP
jgi:NADPH:quinone reductase